MDSDNNDRKPEWAKWSNAGLTNEADDEEVGWYSPYEMYVDLDEETKEVSEKFKTTLGRWEKQKAKGDGKNKNVVPEGPYDMYVDLDEGTQNVSEEFKARWEQWKGEEEEEAENSQTDEQLAGPSCSFPHTEEGQRARRQHERRRKELFTMWEGRGMKGHASKSFKPNEVNRPTTPSGSVSFFIPQERERSAVYRSIMKATSEGTLGETKTSEEATREKFATDSPDTSEFETASETSNPEPCTSEQNLTDTSSITEIKANDVTSRSPSLSQDSLTKVENEANVKNTDSPILDNPPTSPIEDSELSKNTDSPALGNPPTSPIEDSELSQSYTDYEDDFESCSDSDDDEVLAKPRTPACWGVLSRRNVMDYDEWKQTCDFATRHFRCGPQLEAYEVDYSLRKHRMQCQYFSAFYPLVEKRLKFVGGAFSNTCSPIQEEELPDEDKNEDKDSTKSSSPLPISPPLLPPKRKKLRKIAPQRKITSDPGPYIESDESDTDSYDFSLVEQKATTPPPSPSPHFVFLPRRCGKVSPMPHCSKTEVIVVVTSSYDDDDHDDAQNNGCGCCHLLRKMAKRIKKLFK